jgi:hypothetical protein
MGFSRAIRHAAILARPVPSVYSKRLSIPMAITSHKRLELVKGPFQSH